MDRGRYEFSDVAGLMAGVEIVDAHFHCWAPGGPALQSPAAGFNLMGGRSFPGTYLMADYLRDLGSLPVTNAVHIETWAVDPLAELRWVDGLVASSPLPVALVAGVALQDQDCDRVIDVLAGNPRVCGVRQILSSHPDPAFSYIDRDDLMDEPSWRRGFARIADYGLSFDLQIYPGQMPQAASLAQDFPQIPIVICHAGMPIGRSQDALRSWREGMSVLSESPNVSVKLSGIAMTDHDWTCASVKAIVDGVLNLFGPSRSMFGSNFPVDKAFGSYDETVATLAYATAGLSLEERTQIFSGTAKRFYHLSQ